MNKIKIILGYLFGFLASFFIACLTILLILNGTVFNKSYVTKRLEKNNYYENVQKEIIDDMKAYMISSGLSEEILNNLVSDKEIRKDTNNFLTSIYKGETYKFSDENIRARLLENIDAYLNKHNLSITNQKMLDEFVDDIVQFYDDEIQLYGYTNQVVSKFYKISIIIDKAIIVLGILSVVSIIVLLLLRFEYIYSVVSASGLILLFISFIIRIKIDINNIYIISNTFSTVLIDLLKSIIKLNNIIGFLLFIFGMILALIHIIFQKKEKISKKVLKKNN